MQTSLTSIAKSLCQYCSTNDVSATVSLEGTPNCGDDQSGVFSGIITSSTANRTVQLYEALGSWYTNSPILLVDNVAYSIDQTCQLLVQDGEIPTECVTPTDPTPTTTATESSIDPTVVWAIVVGVIVALIVIVVVILVILLTVFIKNICTSGKDDRADMS